MILYMLVFLGIYLTSVTGANYNDVEKKGVSISTCIDFENTDENCKPLEKKRHVKVEKEADSITESEQEKTPNVGNEEEPLKDENQPLEEDSTSNENENEQEEKRESTTDESSQHEQSQQEQTVKETNQEQGSQ